MNIKDVGRDHKEAVKQQVFHSFFGTNINNVVFVWQDECLKTEVHQLLICYHFVQKYSSINTTNCFCKFTTIRSLIPTMTMLWVAGWYLTTLKKLKNGGGEDNSKKKTTSAYCEFGGDNRRDNKEQKKEKMIGRTNDLYTMSCRLVFTLPTRRTVHDIPRFYTI